VCCSAVICCSHPPIHTHTPSPTHTHRIVCMDISLGLQQHTYRPAVTVVGSAVQRSPLTQYNAQANGRTMCCARRRQACPPMWTRESLLRLTSSRFRHCRQVRQLKQTRVQIEATGGRLTTSSHAAVIAEMQRSVTGARMLATMIPQFSTQRMLRAKYSGMCRHTLPAQLHVECV